MSLTSVKFLLFLVLTGIVYYVLPKKMQCYSLLVASIAFYCMAGVPWTFLYLFVSIITVYAGKNHVTSAEKVNKWNSTV